MFNCSNACVCDSIGVCRQEYMCRLRMCVILSVNMFILPKVMKTFAFSSKFDYASIVKMRQHRHRLIHELGWNNTDRGRDGERERAKKHSLLYTIINRFRNRADDMFVCLFGNPFPPFQSLYQLSLWHTRDAILSTLALSLWLSFWAIMRLADPKSYQTNYSNFAS